MIEVAFPAVARSVGFASRAGRSESAALPLTILIAFAILSSAAAILHPLQYADMFSRF